MGWFVVCLFLARKKCPMSYWESPVAGCVGPALREGMEHAGVAAAVFGACLPCKEHVCVQAGQSPRCFTELRSPGSRDVSKFEVYCLGKNVCFFCYIK